MKRLILFFISTIIMAILLASCAKPERSLSVSELLNLGEKYLLELNYEQALVQFLRVIEIEPMNPRGYIGAAQAHIGLGQIDSAVAILRDGLRVFPDNAQIQSMLDGLLPPETQGDSQESALDSVVLSPAEIAAQEPWRLFSNILQADEAVVAGVPIWDATIDIVAGVYPGGSRSSGNWSEDSRHYFPPFGSAIVAFNTTEASKMASIAQAAFRGLEREMGLDDVLVALGFAEEGVNFVKEAIESEDYGFEINFPVREGACAGAHISPPRLDEFEFSLVFFYNDIPNYSGMNIFLGFRDRALTAIQVSAFNWD
jgi:hypothetical protein